jgi:hypothetical protein
MTDWKRKIKSIKRCFKDDYDNEKGEKKLECGK